MTSPSTEPLPDEEGMLDASDVVIEDDPNFVPEEVLADDDADANA